MKNILRVGPNAKLLLDNAGDGRENRPPPHTWVKRELEVDSTLRNSF